MKSLTAALLTIAALLMAASAQAGLVTLQSGSSVAEIDPDSSSGVIRWDIGGTSQLSQQWFWLRTDLDGLDAREYSLNEISSASVDQFLPNIARITYAEPRLSVEVTYALVSGAGLTSADMAEIIKITNRTEDDITINFFQYSDFDLGGDAEDEEVRITGGNTVFQRDKNGTILSETVASGSPDLSEVAEAPHTLDKLEDGDIDDLDGSTSLVGPADMTWAFQWKDRIIPGGQALIISKDKAITQDMPIPEPAGLGLLGIAMLAGRKRRG